MNRISSGFVSFACVIALTCVGCKGNPFSYRDSLMKSRPPSEQWEPKAETADSLESASLEEPGIVRTGFEQESEFDRPKQRASQTTNDQTAEISELMQRAAVALEMGNHNKATAFYQEVVRLQPNHKGALYRLARLYDQQGKFPQAENLYRHALAMDPSDPNLLNDMGYAYLRQKRLVESERFLQSAMQIDPNNQTTLGNLGILYKMQGELQTAEDYFLRAGLSPAAAQLEYTNFLASISAPDSQSQSTSISALEKSQRSPNPSGQFAPASPDWESTYGLKSQSSPRTVEGAALEDRNQPGMASTSQNRIGSIGSPSIAANSDAATQLREDSLPESNSSNYELERAALNAGPGSLFPIAAIDPIDSRKAQPHQPFAGLRDWNNVQPVGFGESASLQRRDIPHNDSQHYRSSSPRQEPPFIQTPLGRATDSRSSNTDSTGFPVTQDSSSNQGRIAPSYYQFPGTSSTQPVYQTTADEVDSATRFPGASNYR